MKISLLVIRCQNIELSKRFYESLGLSFVKETHGNGPTHYACEHDGFVFELYPNKGKPPQDKNRLGFKVSNLKNIAEHVNITSTYQQGSSTIYVLTDPDGRNVEISE